MQYSFFSLATLAVLGLSAGTLSATPEQGESTSQSIFQQLDKNSDGTVSAEEVPQDKERFFDHLIRTGDQNKDGKLTKAEFESSLKKEDQKFPAAQGSDQDRNRRGMQDFMSRLDRNGDKKISRDELPEPLRDRLEPLFKRMNTDAIPLDALQRFGSMNRGRPNGDRKERPRPSDDKMAQDRYERFFQSLDTNKDGKLTMDEAPERGKQILKQIYRQANKDTDTPLSKQEFTEAVKQSRSERRPGDRGQDTEMKRPEMNNRPEGRRGDSQGRMPQPAFMKSLDTNQDGKLDSKELEQMKDLLKKLDRNEDGSLDLRELMGGDRGGFSPRGRQRDRMNRPRRPSADTQENKKQPESDSKKPDA
ncbi:EF-hand domain-containing protein [Gimesia algae]|uniref:EF hand n=1 Tax=Gimesia algae TaxID=2527971 RepID=A0A517V7E5_9PLAN|nr:EF-hand domain-containing protein [Gimesia algae]QDT88927.1 EF hand [Gimesia algae]